MAEPMDDIPIHANVFGRVYPLDEWLDGRWWKIVKGEDFTSSLKAFRNRLTIEAQKRGMTSRVRTEDDVAYYIQATKKVKSAKRGGKK